MIMHICIYACMYLRVWGSEDLELQKICFSVHNVVALHALKNCCAIEPFWNLVFVGQQLFLSPFGRVLRSAMLHTNKYELGIVSNFLVCLKFARISKRVGVCSFACKGWICLRRKQRETKKVQNWWKVERN